MNGIGSRRHFSCAKLSTIALAIGLLAGASGTAWAQDKQSDDGKAKSESSQTGKAAIIVTGSRLAKSTFETTNPVTVINQKDIENLNLNNVGEIVAEMPSNSNFFAANNVGLGNFNVGAQLVNLRGLNPFFGTRTLTLVDTKRVVPTTTGGGVDVTLIPSMLVARTETVTGGASAIYGSDAVAGVVNIILDTKFTGLKAQVDFSRTTHGDGNVFHASGAWGTAFDEDRGHFVFCAEYQKTDAIGICSEVRDWCKSSYGVFTNEDYLTNGKPHYIVGPNAAQATSSLTGVLVPCTSIFIVFCQNDPAEKPPMQFNEAGNQLIPYDPGNYAFGAGIFGFRQGGDQYAIGAYDSTTMRPSVKKYSLLGHLTYDVSSSVTASLEGWYARSEAVNPVANAAIGPYAFQLIMPGVFTGYTISQDNAFLTPDEASYVGPLGAGFGRGMLNLVTGRNETNNSTWHVVGSLEGNIGAGWSWDAYFQHGENKNDQHLYHNVVGTFLRYALDAVDDGSGHIVCGVDIPGRYSAADVAKAAAGGTCVPLNLFGTSNADPAAIDYAFRTLEEFSTYKQDVGAVNVRGNLFDGFGAGPVKLATGIEWRREHGDVTHNLANQPWYTDYFLSYGLDYAGTIETIEGYGEINLPVFQDSAIGKYLELDGAIRGTHNKVTGTGGVNAGLTNSHDFVTWKISGIWDLTDWLRIRGTRSRDVRSPQFRELFQSYNVTSGPPFGSVANPWFANANESVNLTTGGSIDLVPEKADTWTFGIVLAPKQGALSSFRFSADWYQITIKDAILGPPFGIGAQNIVNQCHAGIQSYCDRITFGPDFLDPDTNDPVANSNITAVNNLAGNLQSFVTRGIDFEAAYTVPVNTGSLNFRVLASYLYDQLFSQGLSGAGGTVPPPLNYAGQSGPTAAFGTFNTSPKWQGNAFMTYKHGPFTGTVQLRYIGPGKLYAVTPYGGVGIGPGDPGYSTTDPNSVSDNHIPSAAYVNLSAAFDITENFTLFGSINNLFDKNPPMAPGGNGYPTNPVYFDTYGRTWRVGIRAKM